MYNDETFQAVLFSNRRTVLNVVDLLSYIKGEFRCSIYER